MRHAYGLVHDRHDDRDFRFSHLRYGLAPLPPMVDWRPQGPAIRDQGHLGACTGFGCCRGVELAHALAGSPITVRSPLWLYWQERWIEHTILEDAGAMPRDGLAVAKKVGIAPEVDWPYVPSEFTMAPPQDLANAAPAEIGGYYRCNNVYEVKQALANKHPVVAGIQVWESFESDEVAQTGVIPLPNTDTEELLGGHCICFEGYNDTTGEIIAANSWGTSWGSAGYFVLPYAFFDPQAGFVTDLWAVVI